MSAKKRLLDALFDNERNEHVNIKFFRGPRNDVSVEELCEAVSCAILDLDLANAETRSTFGDATRKQLTVEEIIARV